MPEISSRGAARLVSLATLALLVFAPKVWPQSYQLVGCYAPDPQPLKVTASASFWNNAATQTPERCERFCRLGQAPEGADVRSVGRPPHTYMLMENVWCFCGNEIEPSARVLDRAYCATQEAALKQPGSPWGTPTSEGKMVYTVATGSAPPAAAAPAAPPAPNRPANAPTVEVRGWEPPFPLREEGAVILNWRNNGDPDGDPVSFILLIYQFDGAQRRWVPVSSLRDPFGNPGGVWTNQTAYTFTMQSGLQANAYYAWIVGACDQRGNTWGNCVFSSWTYLRTIW
jgi:hypothetical protein